jgi:hypothetical protein
MAWKISSDPRISSHAVDLQMRNWELGRSQRYETRSAERPEVEDFIAISRQVGVSTEEIAQRLGERLDWPVFGRSLLEAMAGDDAIRQQLYKSMDERDLKWWEGALFPLFIEDYGRNDYFRRLCETVLSLARQGRSVFVGRGCDRVLPAHLGYRVRLIAPESARRENFAAEHGLEPEAAAREMEKIAGERTEFIRHHFKVEADDPTRHDLILNLGRVSSSEAVAIILAGREQRRHRQAAAATGTAG